MSAFSNPLAERGLLASMIEYSEAYHQGVALGIRAEHFADEQNRLVFRAVLRVGEAGHPVTFETVLTELQKAPGIEKVSAVLEDLTNPLHMPRRDVEWHVAELQEKACRTRLVAACKRAISAAEDPGEPTSSCVEYLQESMLEIEAESISEQATHLKDFMPQVLHELEARSLEKGLIGLPTGIGELDDSTTGLRPGELWVIGAMPGHGKTALGAQIALANASAGKPVAFISLEMRKDELGCRFLSNESTVQASRIRNPAFIRKEQWVELANCGARLSQWPLYIDEAPSLTLQAVIARARLYIRRFGCRLIVVDYLRLIKAPGRELREQVGNAIDGLRQLAKRERVAVLALSQLSRPKDQNVNRRPTMLSLKESGDIEAHAHVVLLIHMPIKHGETTGEDEIIIGKNRHGPMGTIEVTFSHDSLKFLPRRKEEAAKEVKPSLFSEANKSKTVN